MKTAAEPESMQQKIEWEKKKTKHFILRPEFVCFVVLQVERILKSNQIVDANEFPIGMCIEFNRIDCN